jgi:ribosomal protein S6
MAQIINNYEMMLIAHQSVTDEVINESITNLVDVINANEGQLLTQDDWGRVRTAYPINKQSFSKYILLEYVAPATVPLELERLVRFDDKTFLRFLTVRLEDNVKDLEALKEAAEARLTKRQETVAAMKQDKVRR